MESGESARVAVAFPLDMGAEIGGALRLQGGGREKLSTSGCGYLGTVPCGAGSEFQDCRLPVPQGGQQGLLQTGVIPKHSLLSTENGELSTGKGHASLILTRPAPIFGKCGGTSARYGWCGYRVEGCGRRQYALLAVVVELLPQRDHLAAQVDVLFDQVCDALASIQDGRVIPSA